MLEWILFVLLVSLVAGAALGAASHAVTDRIDAEEVYYAFPSP